MDEAYRKIGHHLQVLIQLRLADDTWRGWIRCRQATEVRELTGTADPSPTSCIAANHLAIGSFARV